MGERISDSCVRPVVTFSVYLSPLPYTHGPYDHILSIKENHTGKNSKPIPATAAYLSYLLVRPSFASSDRNLLCPPIPSPTNRPQIILVGMIGDGWGSNLNPFYPFPPALNAPKAYTLCRQGPAIKYLYWGILIFFGIIYYLLPQAAKSRLFKTSLLKLGL